MTAPATMIGSAGSQLVEGPRLLEYGGNSGDLLLHHILPDNGCIHHPKCMECPLPECMYGVNLSPKKPGAKLNPESANGKFRARRERRAKLIAHVKTLRTLGWTTRAISARTGVKYGFIYEHAGPLHPHTTEVTVA